MLYLYKEHLDTSNTSNTMPFIKAIPLLEYSCAYIILFIVFRRVNRRAVLASNLVTTLDLGDNDNSMPRADDENAHLEAIDSESGGD